MNIKTLNNIGLVVFGVGTICLILSMIIIPVGGMASTNEHAQTYMYMFGISEVIALIGIVICFISKLID